MRSRNLSSSWVSFLLLGFAVMHSAARAENLADGAVQYKRDLEDLEYHLLDTGHFALETHGQEIADLIRDFLSRKVERSRLAAN